ncbi:selenide, water dikinase SelD [Pleionea sp. CnH1-48]|uniref:selenide, water dikinase SelD n=1 Tax=Pleionea sp. CnH1-48 TaxID=2954494 RepID=UPI002097C760|nr:selenide, water dikinase SelD [Pleionea sp. CnH1-48]MCO7224627.1 selenide, water dikinase SelD [Pleionea sp. CnH1-48]
MSSVKLTEYSHGAGCGCKISPSVLETIVQSNLELPSFPSLVIGNDSKDDAAVVDLGDGTGVISTTDFFMPIVDDPYDFGRVSATNAISDIYAMGGQPLMAIAILGWPVNTLSADIAQQVVEGGRAVCAEANIPLAGGHSIDAPEPIFGLAVTGRVKLEYLKANNSAQEGDLLYLSKPLGVGILTTAQKKKILQAEHSTLALESMTRLNDLGAKIAHLPYVHGMTDVTGFGLAGHLVEMAEGSKLSAQIDFTKLPLIQEAEQYRLKGAVPGGTLRNFDSYGHKLSSLSEEQKQWLCDPQTSGGLLMSVDPSYQDEFEALMAQQGYALSAFGKMIQTQEYSVML